MIETFIHDFISKKYRPFISKLLKLFFILNYKINKVESIWISRLRSFFTILTYKHIALHCTQRLLFFHTYLWSSEQVDLKLNSYWMILSIFPTWRRLHSSVHRATSCENIIISIRVVTRNRINVLKLNHVVCPVCKFHERNV